MKVKCKEAFSVSPAEYYRRNKIYEVELTTFKKFKSFFEKVVEPKEPKQKGAE